MYEKVKILLFVCLWMLFSSTAVAQIIVEDAGSVWDELLDAPTVLPEIAPRFVVEYASSIYHFDIEYPEDIINVAEDVPLRIIIEYATSIAHDNLVPFDVTYLDVSFPAGGEVLNKGQEYLITWNSANVTGNIQIDLFKGGTGSEHMIMQLAAAAPNTGEYIFFMPNFLDGGADYRIGISTENGQVWNFSPSSFTIPPLKCTVQSEIGDAEVTTGDEITYRICIENPEVQTLNDIEIISPVPNGTAFVSATGVFTYLEQEQEVKWDIGSLYQRQVICFEMAVEVAANPGSLVANTVIVNTDTYSATLAPYLTVVTDNSIQDLGIISQEIPDSNPMVLGEDYLEVQPPGTSFDPDFSTYIISHGFNWKGSLVLPPWQLDMAEAIKTAFDGEINVMTWNWLSYATSDHNGVHPLQSILGVPYNKVEVSGRRLAAKIREIIPPSYEKDINLIGFSLGTGVIAYASKYLDSDILIYKDNIKRLTLLDSPWYRKYPGGDFFYSGYFVNSPDRPLVDNYYSALGRIGINLDERAMTWGFAFADTNALLCNTEGPFAGHSYAHEWYLSSISDFNPIPGSDPPQNSLGDTTFPTLALGEHLEYGFYWDGGTSGYFSHVPGDPQWFLIPEKVNCWTTALGTFIEGVLLDVNDLIDGYYVDAKGAVIDKKNEIIDLAKKTKSKIEILSVQAFQTAESMAKVITDSVDHSSWVEYAVSNIPYQVLRLIHNSDASVSVELDIPERANSLRFSFEFPLADSGSILEVFIDNLPVSIIHCDDYVQKGWQKSEWIDVSAFAGQKVNLIFRSSNSAANSKGVALIDDIILAKIIPSIDTDGDNVLDSEDNCIYTSNTNQLDTDMDSVGDECDICPATPDPDQIDTNCDCDVDGVDLAEIIATSYLTKISAFALNFGRTDCP